MIEDFVLFLRAVWLYAFALLVAIRLSRIEDASERAARALELLLAEERKRP